MSSAPRLHGLRLGLASSGLASSGLALFGLVLLVAGCRSRAGDSCRCASDCGAGLECYAMGEKVLQGDACFKAGIIGTCVVSESIDTDSVGEPLSDMPIRDDLPSKRDLAGPGGSDSDSATSEPETSSTTATTTSTTDDTTTDTTTVGTTDTTTVGTTDTTTAGTTDTTTVGTTDTTTGSSTE